MVSLLKKTKNFKKKILFYKMLPNQLKELTLSFSFDGILKILRSKRLFNTLFWFLYLIGSTGLASYYIYETILSFLNYDVVTVKTEYEPPTEFPTVTFCRNKNGEYFQSNSKIAEVLSSTFGFENLISESHFVKINSGMRGYCFRFNSGKNMSNHSIPLKKTFIEGKDAGLLFHCYFTKIYH